MRTLLERIRRAPLFRRTPARLLLAVALAALLLARGRTITLDCIGVLSPAAMAETDAMNAMSSMSPDAWFASHPARVEQSLAAPVDSFTVNNFFFDNNGSSASAVDTAKIVQGDAILWKWIAGSHTVTNGTGSADPNVGTLFNAPSNTSNRRFTFQFDSVGTVPFFCVIHEIQMKGIVVVSKNLASVGPPVASGEVGFTRSPWPNPTSGATNFRYALARGGHARLTILDPQGRRVATLLDSDVDAGTFESHWSGRTSEGVNAPAGIYFARIELPGRTQTQRIARTR